MNVGQAIAAILKEEGVEILFCYPTNRLIDEAALVGIRPIVVRQERTGIHMADAYSRLSAGEAFGVFSMQHGPGAENSFGGVAQAFAESSPVLVIAQGYPRRLAAVSPNFRAAVSMRDVTKSAECLDIGDEVGNVMRRAFSQLRNGRGGPVLVEVPQDVWSEELTTPLDYRRACTAVTQPSAADVRAAVDELLKAASPVIIAGQGVHYSRAWDQLRVVSETLNIPVVTTLPGKSAFPEDHPLSVGAGGLTYPDPVKAYVNDADLILGVGCSFTDTLFAVRIPPGPRVVHITLDPAHLNKDVRADIGLVGDAALTLEAILAELARRGTRPAYADREIAAAIRVARDEWLARWMPHLCSDVVPLSPYRVIWDLLSVVGDQNTVITNDAGRPRDQLSPFWVSRRAQSFIGWGKTTQLGYSLGLAMGAKLARPDAICINVWGDAAIGFTGTDLETAVRAGIPILSVLLNNQGMATELKNIPNAIRLYDAADIGGNYRDMALALGLYAERVESPQDVIPALSRGVEQTRLGRPALIEFMTRKETAMSGSASAL